MVKLAMNGVMITQNWAGVGQQMSQDVTRHNSHPWYRSINSLSSIVQDGVDTTIDGTVPTYFQPHSQPHSQPHPQPHPHPHQCWEVQGHLETAHFETCHTGMLPHSAGALFPHLTGAPTAQL